MSRIHLCYKTVTLLSCHERRRLWKPCWSVGLSSKVWGREHILDKSLYKSLTTYVSSPRVNSVFLCRVVAILQYVCVCIPGRRALSSPEIKVPTPHASFCPISSSIRRFRIQYAPQSMCRHPGLFSTTSHGSCTVVQNPSTTRTHPGMQERRLCTSIK
jgi:hypothetical protein